MKRDLEEYFNKKIVIDSTASWIYIGVLERVSDHCVVHYSCLCEELVTLRHKVFGIMTNTSYEHMNGEDLIH